MHGWKSRNGTWQLLPALCLFPNRIAVGPPQEDAALQTWDVAALKAEHNCQRLHAAMDAGVVTCKELREICTTVKRWGG